MVRLPLLINNRRIRTLEELRENFFLAELLERFRSGQLRAWLYNWNFNAEQEQVEALASDLPEAELAEALCRIFGIDGKAKEQTFADFQEEQAKRKQEVKHQLEQQEAEEQRKAEQNRPLTLDEIEFDWQEAEGPNVEFLASGADRFVTLPSSVVGTITYSYDGLHWEEITSWSEHPMTSCVDHFYYCNNYFIILNNDSYNIFDHRPDREFHYSSDSVHWKTAKIDDNVKEIKKIIWADGHYVALCTKSDTLYYTEKVLFMDVGKTASWKRPVVYTAPDLAGPWREEKIGGYRSGDSLADVIFFQGNLIFTGNKALQWHLYKNCKYEQFYYTGSSIGELKPYFFGRNNDVPSKIWSGCGKCFWSTWHDESTWNNFYDFAHMTEDGSHWSEIKYGMTDCLDAQRFLVARLALLDLSSSYAPASGRHDGKDIGFHISVDGVNWKKLDVPLQNGKLAYMAGKLLIADRNKFAVGTLRTDS